MSITPPEPLSAAPVVSVVVPCFDRASYLRETLESILQQDYPHIQCIVIDGGSHDGTVEILESYGDRIEWQSEPDNGQVDAIRKGLARASGEVVTWLNADDLWEVPGAVSHAVACLQEDPAVDVIYGNCRAIDADGRDLGMLTIRRFELEFAATQCDHCFAQAASFIRRRAMDRVGGPDPDPGVPGKFDTLLWIQIGVAGGFRFTPEILGSARILPEDNSHRWQTGDHCVNTTRKVFAMPELPDSIRRQRARAMSNAWLRGANYVYYGGGGFWMFQRFILRAVLASPLNSPMVIRFAIWAALDRILPQWLIRWSERLVTRLAPSKYERQAL